MLKRIEPLPSLGFVKLGLAALSPEGIIIDVAAEILTFWFVVASGVRVNSSPLSEEITFSEILVFSFTSIKLVVLM